MPLIPVTGRRSLKVRLIFAALYAILILGGISMVYPFLLMVCTATTSNADWREFRVPPRYWFDREAQFRKFVLDRGHINVLAYDYGQEEWFSGSQILPEHLRAVLNMPAAARSNMVADFAAFVSQLPPELKYLNFIHQGAENYSVFSVRPEYFSWLAQRYGSLDVVNRAYDDTATRWGEIGLPPGVVNVRWIPNPRAPRLRDWREFVQTRPLHQVRLISLDMLVFSELRNRYGTVTALNAMHGTRFASFFDITWRVLEQYDWGRSILLYLLRDTVPLEQILLRPSAQPAFERMIARYYPRKSIPFSPRVPDDVQQRAAFMRFIRSTAARFRDFEPIDPDVMFRVFLSNRYGAVSNLNLAWQTSFSSWDQIRPPAAAVDADFFLNHRPYVVLKFLLGNFSVVLNFIYVNGSSLVNTIIYILLSIGTALTVNPMAAYALSRFRLKYAHHILIFLLATMAFPAEVVMIPSFLMIKSFPLGAIILAVAAFLLWFITRALLLRRLPLFWSALIGLALSLAAAYYLPPVVARALGREDLTVSLMNTFFALVMPGMANAYSVFLLKGFFDSLPPELYEAAMLDGAGELRMFWSITLPLCKPILAVISLGAFTTAYGAFMFAFLTCQDPKMWTLMVFLYQFQQTYSVPLVMASLVITAIPTLLVFIFCQNIILRGIVIPTFK